MKQKLCVALAVAVLALSGARETSKQFHQLKSFVGGWTNAGVWNSLLVYAVGDAVGVAPRQPGVLVASDSTSCAGTAAETVARARRSAKAARHAARAKKVAPAGPKLELAELALSFADMTPRGWSVDKFDVRVQPIAGEGAKGLGREFVYEFGVEAAVARWAEKDFETQRAQVLAELGRTDLVLKIARLGGGKAGHSMNRFMVRLPEALRLRFDARHDEDSEPEARAEADRDGDGDDYSTPTPAPVTATSLLNCDTQPRR